MTFFRAHILGLLIGGALFALGLLLTPAVR